DDILKAVADFASQAARISLSTPNVGDYASYLASLMGTGLPGLDPAGSAGIGQAGLNFSYAALMRGSRGITDPIMAEGLWEGGLFGTTAGVFGRNSALGQWYKAHGLALPGLDGT